MFDDVCLPFGSELSFDNRWIKFAELILWAEVEEGYAPQIYKAMRTPRKPLQMALASLIPTARLRLTVEKVVDR